MDIKIRRICAVGISLALAVGMFLVAAFVNAYNSAALLASFGFVAVAILDVVLYFLFEGKTDNKFLIFVKNTVYYIIFVVEVLAAALIALLMAEDESVKAFAEDSGFTLAVAPAFALGIAIKPFLYRLTYRKEKFNELTAFVSIASHVVGYLLGLIIVFVGEKVSFIFQGATVILFIAGIVASFKFVFLDLPFKEDDEDEYGYGYSGYSPSSYGNSNSSSGSSKGKSSSGGNSSDGPIEATYAHNEIVDGLKAICSRECGERIYDSSLYADIDVYYKKTGRFTYVLQYDVHYWGDAGSNSSIHGYSVDLAKRHINLGVDTLRGRIEWNAKGAIDKAMQLVKNALLKHYPAYSGEYGVSADMNEQFDWRS